ncbi:ABC transporter ATP-binding protein [Bdellovibrio reynosensis]|uniref:ABC transporter ATP-binding protein/permease n=1 Tax=Bdellovibrio reynosensis TaxID=2835041 RepID=A0ABY4CAZ0_9BACT|nr:ABC transporter ATP-binding protein [Bdellovibrio reynosensis]UOF02137.1 ABC transporter ATP-binding protein/permease [Bdellovibrio reynosensis]
MSALHKSSFKSFARLFKYSANHKKDFYLGSLYSFLNKLFDIAPEILIGIAIDVVVNQEKSFLAQWGVETPLHQLILLSVLTLAIWGFESLFEYLLLVKWRGLAQSLQHEFRVDAYTHLQKLDMAYFEDRSTGGLVSILNDDINQLERFLNEGMNSLIQVFTAVVLIGAVFFFIAPKIAIFAFLPIPIILAGAFYFQKQAAPLYLEVRDRAGLIGARLANNISGIATIRSFVAEAREAKRVSEDSHNYVESNSKAIKISSRFNPLIRMAVLMGFISTFVMGGMMTLNGELNVGSYGVLVFLTQRLLWPLTGLANTVDLFERAMASADRVLDLLSAKIQLETLKPSVMFNKDMSIDFKNLSFSYANGIPVLKNIDLQVPAGKTVAIVGPTGSGKSTITKLLLRFYQATQGKILLGGLDIETCDPRNLRGQIGVVSQDVFLFHGTIYENISYGAPGATREEVLAAAKKAYADEFIDKLPQGIDTIIGERGQKLSGGQRQRLSIARVILKNPPVLILDEATSAVDNETEAVIQKSLAEISKDRTTIIIAHRLSTVTHADKICVVVNGEIAEEGTHEALLQKGQTYAQLWNLQIRKPELAL